MKKLIMLSIVLGILVMLTGCGADVPGKYVNVYDETEYVTLKENGTFTAKIKKQNYTGKYSIAGNKINFMMDSGKDSWNFDGGVMLDKEGNSFIKD